LLNRAAFFEQLRDISARPARETERSALILLNLDRFREINDTYGVAMGDEILSETARRLRRCLRDSDVISRLNGDEFGVLLPELSAADDIEKVGAKILSRLLEPHDVGGPQPFLVTCSLGIALIPPGSSTDQILRLANRALIAAKRDGGRQYQTIEAVE
jgi:diguanylate cyclase (GGDEF)-like protein